MRLALTILILAVLSLAVGVILLVLHRSMDDIYAGEGALIMFVVLAILASELGLDE